MPTWPECDWSGSFTRRPRSAGSHVRAQQLPVTPLYLHSRMSDFQSETRFGFRGTWATRIHVFFLLRSVHAGSGGEGARGGRAHQIFRFRARILAQECRSDNLGPPLDSGGLWLQYANGSSSISPFLLVQYPAPGARPEPNIYFIIRRTPRAALSDRREDFVFVSFLSGRISSKRMDISEPFLCRHIGLLLCYRNMQRK